MIKILSLLTVLFLIKCHKTNLDIDKAVSLLFTILMFFHRDVYLLENH